MPEEHQQDGKVKIVVCGGTFKYSIKYIPGMGGQLMSVCRCRRASVPRDGSLAHTEDNMPERRDDSYTFSLASCAEIQDGCSPKARLAFGTYVTCSDGKLRAGVRPWVNGPTTVNGLTRAS